MKPTNTTRALFLSVEPDYRANNDPWGHAMGAFFAVCDVLAFQHNAIVPDEWQFSPSPFGPASEGYAWETLQELAPSVPALVRLGWFLHRLTARLDRAGCSY